MLTLSVLFFGPLLTFTNYHVLYSVGLDESTHGLIHPTQGYVIVEEEASECNTRSDRKLYHRK